MHFLVERHYNKVHKVYPLDFLLVLAHWVRQWTFPAWYNAPLSGFPVHTSSPEVSIIPICQLSLPVLKFHINGMTQLCSLLYLSSFAQYMGENHIYWPFIPFKCCEVFHCLNISLSTLFLVRIVFPVWSYYNKISMNSLCGTMPLGEELLRCVDQWSAKFFCKE